MTSWMIQHRLDRPTVTLLTSRCIILLCTTNGGGSVPTLLPLLCLSFSHRHDKHCRDHLWSTVAEKKEERRMEYRLEFYFVGPSAHRRTECKHKLPNDYWRVWNNVELQLVSPEWRQATTSRLSASLQWLKSNDTSSWNVQNDVKVGFTVRNNFKLLEEATFLQLLKIMGVFRACSDR